MRLNNEEFCRPTLEVSSLRSVNDGKVFTSDGKREMWGLSMSVLNTGRNHLCYHAYKNK